MARRRVRSPAALQILDLLASEFFRGLREARKIAEGEKSRK